MFRSTLLGSVLAVCMAPLSVGLNSFMTPAPKEDLQLAESLASLSTTLASFEQRQTGSEADLTRQLESLAGIVATTQQASQSQIESLSKSLAEVRSVAMQPADTIAFADLLQDFGNDLEKKVEAKINMLVKAEVEQALPATGVGTLDVNNTSATGDAEAGSIQTMPDAARRIVALEKEVAALKARSPMSSAAAPASSVYYESYPSSGYSVVNGGSTGSVVSGGSTGSYSYSQPVQQTYYSQPVQRTYSSPTYYYSAPATSQRRTEYTTGVRSAFGQCRIVNGVRICN